VRHSLIDYLSIHDLQIIKPQYLQLFLNRILINTSIDIGCILGDLFTSRPAIQKLHNDAIVTSLGYVDDLQRPPSDLDDLTL
jgi:hypothetical protein